MTSDVDEKLLGAQGEQPDGGCPPPAAVVSSAFERKWIGAKVSVLIRLAIDCHIGAVVTKASQKSNMVWCEIPDNGGGWETHSGWRTIGERVSRGIYGDTQPTFTVIAWPNTEVSHAD